MMGVLGMGADLTKWPQEDLDKAAELIALYKEIRDTMQFGAFYRLRSPRESALSAFQFIHPSGDESVVVVFLSQSQFGHFDSVIHLEGLEPDAHYRVEGWDDLWSGQALMKRGFPIALRGSFASRLIRIVRERR